MSPDELGIMKNCRVFHFHFIHLKLFMLGENIQFISKTTLTLCPVEIETNDIQNLNVNLSVNG